MQTEQFDDEFRRKLLAIHPEPTPDEVDRIHGYVSAGLGGTSAWSWQGLTAYAAAAMLLIGSLLCNYMQNTTIKSLSQSLDSLKLNAATYTQIQAGTPTASSNTIVKTDTIYIERLRYQDRLMAGSQSSLNDPIIRDSTIAAISNALPQKVSQAPGVDSALTQLKIEPGLSRANAASARNSKSQYLPLQTTGANTFIGPANANVQASQNPITELHELSPAGHFELAVVRLQRPAIKAPMTAPSKESVEAFPAKKQFQWPDWHYYAGAGFNAGKDAAGASALGEIRLSPKWSVQTGLGWQQITGPGYYTAEQYKQQTGEDFRKLYAPYVAENVDLLNIEHSYQVIQVPVAFAYHYRLHPAWALRFGLGTDLTVYGQQRIHFDYKEDNLSFDQGEYNASLRVPAFSNLTAQIGIERSWKRFLFRLGPVATWQLRNVAYAKSNFSPGFRLQVLYRIK